MPSWTAELTNDPSRDHDLYIELLENDEYRGRLVRDDEGQLRLVLYPSDTQVSIPVNWLLSVLDAAGKDI